MTRSLVGTEVSVVVITTQVSFVVGSEDQTDDLADIVGSTELAVCLTDLSSRIFGIGGSASSG